ncbi:MAG: hypothetical protein WCL00_11435, partial [Bacteroidota bacterium]
MKRSSWLFSLILGLIISSHLYSQKPVVPIADIGIRQTVFLSSKVPHHFDEAIFAAGLPVFFRINRNEWYAGLVFPLVIPNDYYYFLNKSTIGASTGYKFYIFNPR